MTKNKVQECSDCVNFDWCEPVDVSAGSNCEHYQQTANNKTEGETTMSKEYLAGLTVEELRKMCKENGLPQQEKGKKFTKTELVDRLAEKLIDTANEIEEMAAELKECGETETAVSDNKTDSVAKSAEKPQNSDPTFESIVARYSKRKPQWVYDECLQVDCIILFVHKYETLSGTTRERLRKAKVTSIDRENEKVTLQLLLGDTVEICFDEILYIGKLTNDNGWERWIFPSDIKCFMRNNRTETGRETIKHAFEAMNTVFCGESESADADSETWG